MALNSAIHMTPTALNIVIHHDSDENKRIGSFLMSHIVAVQATIKLCSCRPSAALNSAFWTSIYIECFR